MKVSVTQHDTHCGLQPNEEVVDVVTFYQARSDILSAGKQGRVNQCCAIIWLFERIDSSGSFNFSESKNHLFWFGFLRGKKGRTREPVVTSISKTSWKNQWLERWVFFLNFLRNWEPRFYTETSLLFCSPWPGKWVRTLCYAVLYFYGEALVFCSKNQVEWFWFQFQFLSWVWFFEKQMIPVLVLVLKNIRRDCGPILILELGSKNQTSFWSSFNARAGLHLSSNIYINFLATFLGKKYATNHILNAHLFTSLFEIVWGE
jgi:hypothetical protein